VTASANSACPQRLAEVGQQVAVHYAVSDQPLPRARPEWPQEVVQLKASLRNGLRIFESPRKRDQQFSRLSVQPFTQAEAEASGTVVRGSFAMRGLPLDSPPMTQASPAGALTVSRPPCSDGPRDLWAAGDLPARAARRSCPWKVGCPCPLDASRLPVPSPVARLKLPEPGRGA
jgi:hypothetical protein